MVERDNRSPLDQYLSDYPFDTRPFSISVEDAFIGDSGKGSVVAKLNALLSQRFGILYSLRWNGGANAGHETSVNGQRVVTHQLPMAVIQENAVAIIARTMVIHPSDLTKEIDQIKKLFGSLPGQLLIDHRTELALDTHRAHEYVLNKSTPRGNGSTGRGISSAYAAHYLRIPLTAKDLASNDWRNQFAEHYSFYQKEVKGFGFDLAEIPVKRLDPHTTSQVGSQAQFLDRLEVDRDQLQKYISQGVRDLLSSAWSNSPQTPFTFEGAQGAGLDPYHGVYPDVTASRPMSCHIGDGTYGIVSPSEIALRVAVMKTTYMSSVGVRHFPTTPNPEVERWIQTQFDERGRSTGRLRDIYPVSLPVGKYLRRVAGYDFLIATHLDASRAEIPISVVTEYHDKLTHEKKPYSPYQDDLDELEAEARTFPGWDGEAVKTAQTSTDLPSACQNYLSFLSQEVAPIIMATYGPDLNDYIFLEG